MRVLTTLFATVATATALGAGAQSAMAADTIVYVHGWTPEATDLSSWQGQRTCPQYWQQQLNPDAVPTRHVGWNTSVDWRSSTTANRMFTLLHQYCRTDQGNRCRIVCHSTGCAITGKVLSWYSAHNTPWRIDRVLTLGSAEGGTEIADHADIIGGNPSGVYLSPSTVRSAYNHNQTSGVPFFHLAGYAGDWKTSWAIKGQDDGVVPFHSACGYVTDGDFNMCKGAAAQWTMHATAKMCGDDGCDKTHSALKTVEFQHQVLVSDP